MKDLTLVLSLVLTTILVSCTKSEDQKNPLYGKIFRNIEEIPELKNYEYVGGAVIDIYKENSDDFKYGIGNYRDDNNTVCILKEFVSCNEEGKVNYKILDTINIGLLKENEFLSYVSCFQDTIIDYEIVAIVESNNNFEEEYFDKIVRAWRANIETERFEKIKNLNGIRCINQDYGVD